MKSKKNWDSVKWTEFSTASLKPPETQAQAERQAYIAENKIRIYINSIYQVQIEEKDCPPPFGKCLYLSIKTHDRQPRHDWRELQRIKNELVGENVEAVELYPAEDRVVDAANQYHLFCFPKLAFPEARFPFGFQERLVAEGSTPGINETGKGSRHRGWRPEFKPEDLIQGPVMEKIRSSEMGGRCPRDGTPFVNQGVVTTTAPSGIPVKMFRTECLRGKHVCFVGDKVDVDAAT